MNAHKNKIIIALICLIAVPSIFSCKNKIHMNGCVLTPSKKICVGKHELDKMSCLSPKGLEVVLMLDIYLKVTILGTWTTLPSCVWKRDLRTKVLFYTRVKHASCVVILPVPWALLVPN